jgi:hypothetical protein
MGWDINAEREFWRRKCIDSFWYFFRVAYGYDYNPKGAAGPSPWMEEKTHKPLCDWFEHHALEWLAARKAGRGKQKKLMVIVPRDFGKTTLLAAGGQAWLHLHDPELATYTGCETITRGREILSSIKSVIGGEDRHARYTWLYGSQKHLKRRWKLDAVVTAARTNLSRRDASYGVWAVESGLVGMHPDCCFLDDPNTYERMDRDKEWLDIVNRHVDTLIPVFQKDALWVFTLTRYGEGDHAGKSIKHEGVRSVTGMPMPGLKVEEDGSWDLFFLDAQDEAGTPTMPLIWPPERIKDFERRNPTRYWAQVRNNPVQNPYNILPYSAVERMVCDDKDVDLKKLRVSLHFDTAFKNVRRRARGDYSVVSAVGHEPKTGVCVFLGAHGSTDWDSERFAKQFCDDIKFWRSRCARVSCMTDEDDIGGKPGVWEAFVKTKLMSAGIALLPPLLMINRSNNMRKEERLANVAALWRDGRMKLLRGAAGLDVLMRQMSQIGTAQDNDDYMDATADCFNKQVYNTVWPSVSTDGTEHKHSSNPFDEILKGGAATVNAAERIAKEYSEKELIRQQFVDVICP